MTSVSSGPIYMHTKNTNADRLYRFYQQQTWVVYLLNKNAGELISNSRTAELAKCTTEKKKSPGARVTQDKSAFLNFFVVVVL